MAEPYRGLNAALGRAAAPDAGTDVEALTKTLMELCDSGGWLNVYVEHAADHLLASDWLAAHDAALIAAAEARGAAEAGERIAAESLTLLMRAWGCGPGEMVMGQVADPQTGDAIPAPVGQLCKSTAHEHAYWGEHCGFAGNAAGLVAVAAQNLAARTAPATDRTEATPEGGSS